MSSSDVEGAPSPVRPSGRGRLAGMLLIGSCLLFSPASFGADPAELEALKRSVEESRSRVAGYREKEEGLLAALEALEQREELLVADVRRARSEAKAARELLAELVPRAEAVAQRMAKTRSALASRAVALYKLGELGPVRALFGAGNFEAALSEVRVLQHLVRRDQRLIADFNADAAELASTRRSTEAAAVERDAAVSRAEIRLAELESDRSTRRQLLLSVRRDSDRERGALRELEAAARALEAQLSKLESRSQGPGSFLDLRGVLPSPVEAPIVAGFGRVRDEFATETFRKGLLFATERGAPVFAVADGEVRYAGWFRGYGRLLILDHGDEYFSVIGHLDAFEVDVDDRVRTGDVVGRAGETGSLSGPRVYFEIRHRQEAVDPALWLAPRVR